MNPKQELRKAAQFSREQARQRAKEIEAAEQEKTPSLTVTLTPGPCSSPDYKREDVDYSNDPVEVTPGGWNPLIKEAWITGIKQIRLSRNNPAQEFAEYIIQSIRGKGAPLIIKFNNFR